MDDGGGAPGVEEVLWRFVDYRESRLGWGPLARVMQGGTDGKDAVAVAGLAAATGDAEAQALAGILLRLSGTQRGKLARRVEDRLAERYSEGA